MTDAHATPDQPRLTVYLATYAGLLVGLAATVGLAYVSLGRLNVISMFAVAFAKAAAVVLVFMHVRHAPGLTRIAVAAGLIWLAIMVAFAMSDYLTRGWIPNRDPTPLVAPPDNKSFSPPRDEADPMDSAR
ncbi:MAG TPA: cytochrome C oxidase subunit IV family protein [Lacipirellulaceae bacterium]|nr:cytochrome C oxidase subunit IV family protein [Lacipirellulaceae bacterium]